MASEYPPSLQSCLSLLVLFLETAFILIFYFFVSYEVPSSLEYFHNYSYSAFQDVNVMVVFGFGFFLTFLKRYRLSSVGFTLLITALGVQWALIVEGFLFYFSSGKVNINLDSILRGTLSITAVHISAGALLGKVNPVQLTCMAMMEVTAFAVDRWIITDILKVESHVSMMHVHIFGAYFGLVVSGWFCPPLLKNKFEKEKSGRLSDLFSMIGTLFLWMFWPTFNSVLLSDDVEKRKAIYNTYYAIAVSAVTAFALSAASNRNGKFDMVHVRTATLAGGVALGFSAGTISHPCVAMTLGLLASTIAVLWSRCVQMHWNPALKIHDTCGVHYTFGLPGLLGGIAHVILAVYNNWDNLSMEGYSILIEVGALSFTVVMALGTGFFAGFLLTCKLWKAPPVSKYFDDQAYWEFPNLAVGF
uniref:Ammonium transporter AmtB-like domain-containing protein n=1 Tax=Sphenodon punctatus TaxID=8508 RepID=A0A8D0GKY9_SPHPU